MVEEVEGDDGPGPAHGAAGVVGGQVLASSGIFFGAAHEGGFFARVSGHVFEGDGGV